MSIDIEYGPTPPIKRITVREELRGDSSSQDMVLSLSKWRGELADLSITMERGSASTNIGLSLDEARELFTKGLRFIEQLERKG